MKIVMDNSTREQLEERLNVALQKYADERKIYVQDGLESSAMAAIQVHAFGDGLQKAAEEILFDYDRRSLDILKVCHQIDDHYKITLYRMNNMFSDVQFKNRVKSDKV